MAGEFKHKDIGDELTRAEWEALGAHILDAQVTGDVIYASSATQLSRLAKGTDGQFLKIGASIPAWVDVGAVALALAGGTLIGPLIIHEDTYMQFGTGADRLLILPYLAAGAAGIVLQPAAGNRLGYLELQPKGTSERTQISLRNGDVGVMGSNYSGFAIEVFGEDVNIIFEDVGSPPVSITNVHVANDWTMHSIYPFIDKVHYLGSSSKRYKGIFAEHHVLTQALDTDHTWSGITAPMTAGIALVRPQAVYVGGDSKMEKALATTAATIPAIALATGTIAENASGEFLMQGFFRDNTWTWTPGGLLYVSKDTAGALTQTLPAASGEQVQVVGVAITADIIHFNPSYELVEIS